MRYYSLYDALGWFMTVLGPAPKEATRENYLVPMGSVFCKWSKELSGNNKPPIMASIVHVPSTSQGLISVDVMEDPTPDVALESTIALNKFKDECQQERFEMLKAHGFKLTAEQAPQTPPVYQRFGHCAETYPLTMAMILREKW